MRREPTRPRRKAIPKALRQIAKDRQNGVCICGCGSSEGLEADHHPALILRLVNEAGTDYIPPQLDPDYIVMRCYRSHKAKTVKDVKAKAKIHRIIRGRKPKRPMKSSGRKIPSRPFGKRTRIPG